MKRLLEEWKNLHWIFKLLNIGLFFVFPWAVIPVLFGWWTLGASKK